MAGAKFGRVLAIAYRVHGFSEHFQSTSQPSPAEDVQVKRGQIVEMGKLTAKPEPC